MRLWLRLGVVEPFHPPSIVRGHQTPTIREASEKLSNDRRFNGTDATEDDDAVAAVFAARFQVGVAAAAEYGMSIDRTPAIGPGSVRVGYWWVQI